MKAWRRSSRCADETPVFISSVVAVAIGGDVIQIEWTLAAGVPDPEFFDVEYNNLTLGSGWISSEVLAGTERTSFFDSTGFSGNSFQFRVIYRVGLVDQAPVLSNVVVA